MGVIAPDRLQERALAALAEIEDPEMPINLVDLGLIYGLRTAGSKISVDLSFTAMGCPAAEYIVADVRERLLREPGVEEVEVRVVWDPPWTAQRISPGGRDLLRAWGLAV